MTLRPLRAIACVSLLATSSPPASAADARDANWRKVATPADRARLRRWRVAWMEAFAAIRAAGAQSRLSSQGALFDPDRSLAGATVSSGRYRCRTFRLGLIAGTAKAFIAQDWVDCAVAGMMLETGGVQRVAGRLFADTDARMIFLGTLALGDERRPMRYGRDSQRDMAGLIERIGPQRWRLVLPYPRFGSTLDLIEIAAR